MRSPAELALRCIFPGFEGTTAPAWVLRAAERGLGGVVLYARNIDDGEQLSAMVESLHQARPGLLVAIDEEGGDVTRLEARTGSSYPGNLALGAAGDPTLTEEVARAIGRDLAARGIDLDLAPVADVNTDPRNPVIGVRSFGSNPADSVLDPWCKAHELDNLYVVDTSFFPSIAAVNPTLTAVANAMRVGDHLKARLSGRG